MRLKLDDDVIKLIADAIELGATYEIAAEYAGVGARSLSRWMARGADDEDESSVYRRLWRAVKKAQGRGAVSCLAAIHKAKNAGTWQAAAWLLERRFPSGYGRVESRTLVVTDTNDVATALEGIENMSEPEKREALRKALGWK